MNPTAPVKRVKPPAQALNFDRSGKRQPQQLADHRQRQLAGITRDQVGRTSFREQFVAQRPHMRLHAEHRSAAKGLIDNVAQPLVVGVVHRQHVVGKRANDIWHPPSQSRDGAVVLSNAERRAVLEHLIRQRLRRRGPDPADDREVHFHDRTRATEPLDGGRRIAKIVLTGEVRGNRHDQLLAEKHRGPLRHFSSRARHADSRHGLAAHAPELWIEWDPRKVEGAGKTGCTEHPQPVCKG